MTWTARGAMPRRIFSGRLLAGGAAAAVTPLAGSSAAAAGATPVSSGSPPEAQGGPDGLRRATGGGDTRHLTLFAERLPGGQMGYGLKRGAASVPGPLIELVEGDTLHVELVNTMDVATGLHVHGLDYDVANDGTALNHSVVQPGDSRTYTWRSHAPGVRDDGTYRQGTAGYWHYHDHAVGTPNGTVGIRNGLYGPVVVRRVGDLLPDKQFVIVFNDMTINNKTGADTPNFRATLGDRVEIVMITYGDLYHTFHMHGHRWADNRTGLLAGPDDPSRVVDNKITGPADSFGFQVIAGEDGGPGAWMYHCHVQRHSDMGMGGLLVVADADGDVPPYDPQAMSGLGASGGGHGAGPGAGRGPAGGQGAGGR